MMSPNFQFRQQGESCHHQLGWRTWEGYPESDLGEGEDEGCWGGARDRAGKGVLCRGRGDRVQGSNGDQHSQEIDVYLVSSLCLSAPLEKS